MRPFLAVLTAAAVLVCAAPAAATTTLARDGDRITVTGDDAPSLLRSPGFASDVALRDESGQPVVAGPGCVQDAANAASCGVFGPASRVAVTLGGGADDLKWVLDAPQLIDAGAGDDVVEAGYGNDTISGGDGNDDLNGLRGDDTLDGGAGNDKVDGWDGSDTVTGGPGADTLLGDGGTVYAGGGDVLLARDGEADTVDCGGGPDRATVDAADVVAACAAVDRPVPAPTPTPTPSPTPTPTPSPTPVPAPGVRAAAPRLPTLVGLITGRPLRVAVTADVACTARLRLRVSAAVARRLGYRRAARTLASARGRVPAGRRATVALRPARRVRIRLQGLRELRATVAVGCGTATTTVAIRLRR